MRRLCAFLLFASIVPAVQAQTPKPPRLVVVVSIDQYRADYLRRFRQHYLPAATRERVGGFNYLMEKGANYVDAHYTHVPTETGPGHAVILTGSAPCLNGIVGNVWFDRTLGKRVYCVDDPQSKTVGGTSQPMSPRNLLVTTLGDELKMATNGQSKVVGVAFKDRAAILMAGHAADTVIWFETSSGNWVSSSFYCKTGELPQWVKDLNAEKVPNQYLGKSWTPLLEPQHYRVARVPTNQRASSTTLPFERKIDAQAGPQAYNQFTYTPFGNDYVFHSAKRAIVGERLGQDEVTDILAINLSSNDYVGHAYGPNSPEVMDISIRTDRGLSDFHNYLRKAIPGGLDNVVLVLTADHGVVPIPEESGGDFHTGAERPAIRPAVQAFADEMKAAFGEGAWIESFDFPNIHLNRKLIAEKGLKYDEVAAKAVEALVKLPGVYAVFTREQIMNGALPNWPWTPMVALGYHPRLGGDLLAFERPGNYYGEGTGTGHGSPWVYDTHVPVIVAGRGVNAGTYGRRVSVMDIAPTLALLLGVEYPSGCLGKPLAEAIGK